MKKNIYTICKAIVLICLIILVASNFKVDKDSKASMETVQNKTIEKVNLDGFTQLDNLNITLTL